MNADLVLEGGGMRGIAHVGALTALEEHGYSFQRTAGASAGAIVAAFAAAGVSPARMAALMHDEIDYSQFREARGLARWGLGGRLAAIVRENGAFAGDRLREWLRSALRKEAGVEAFGDLRLGDDPDGPPLAPDERYRLVVVVADVSLGQLVRLPWDYRRLYGLDPDRQLVADAIRASTSIPFFFKPARLRWQAGIESHLVDGALVSDFPIGVFDRGDGRAPRWPTFGVKLSRRRAEATLAHAIDGVRSFATALFETAVGGNDQAHLADPCVASRTIFVDNLGIPATNFDLGPEQRAALFASGHEAATRFLEGWDWETYLRECRGVRSSSPSPPEPPAPPPQRAPAR